MNGHQRLATILIWVGVAACSRSTPISVPPLASEPSVALGWVPADVTLVSHQPGTQVALITYARD